MSPLNLKQITLASALALMGSFPIVEEAEGAIFVKIPGIKGDVAAKGHEGEIDVSSWSWSSAAEGGNTRKAADLCMSEAGFSKQTNISSADLMNNHAMGTVYPAVIVTVVPSYVGGGGGLRGKTYSYELLDAVISHFSYSSGESESHESFSISYSGVMGSLTFVNPDTGETMDRPFEVGPNTCN